MLRVKEIFGPTIQGEGELAGTPAIFVRFSGCNMWSGKPEDQAKSMCPFCDTDFLDGENMEPDEIIEAIRKINEPHKRRCLIVFTGGEPLLQDTEALVHLLMLVNGAGILSQVETNGTINSDALGYFDYVTCSPKRPLEKLKIPPHEVTCLKVLYPPPHDRMEPESYEKAFVCKLYLQPIDLGNETIDDITETNHNLSITVEKMYRLSTRWTLSLQTHKYIGVR